MGWFGRGRGGSGTGGGRHAVLPIPLTGAMLSGEIRDGAGRPVTGAAVTVLSPAGERAAHTITDSFGIFVAAVAPGQIRLRVEAGGFRSVDERLTVEWGGHLALGKIVLVADDDITVPPAGSYTVDTEHSSVRFVARHIAMSRVYGQFRAFSGRVEIAPRFEDSHVEVTIEAASVFTNVEARDTHLRSADFLHVEKFPNLHFTSRGFQRAGGNRWLVDGELTVRGSTSDVQLDTTFLGLQEWNGLRAGALATTTLHREHFAVNWQQMIAAGVPVVGSTVEIVLDVQAVRAS